MGRYDAEIAAIQAAYAAGVKRVVTQTNGSRKEVEYPSGDDMLKRIEYLRGLNSGTRRPRVILAQT